MRIPYTPNPPPTNTSNEADILTRIQARRAPRDLTPLDRTLLHSFPIADGWNSFIGAIRTQTSLPADIRELIISRIAAVNGAWYEWEAHAPLLLKAGMSEEAVRVVQDAQADISEMVKERRVLSEVQGVVLLYTDAVTKTVAVSEEVFRDLREWFDEREVVEVTATVAAYNCVSRFLVALDIGERNG